MSENYLNRRKIIEKGDMNLKNVDSCQIQISGLI